MHEALLAIPDMVQKFGDAVESAIYYVLDGSRTQRFDLLDRRVDPDERRSVGTKLQFHILENLELPRLKSPDTEIAGVPVDLKGTVGSTWSIPREGQCEICLLIKLNLRQDTHSAWVMRTHRVWLHGDEHSTGNGDQKRGVVAEALRRYALPLYTDVPLRPNPLKKLTDAQAALVFGPEGQRRRLVHLFTALPGVVIPREVILTVCANNDDPLRRTRQARAAMRRDHQKALLCGTWDGQRKLGAHLGFDLTGAAWVSVDWQDVLNAGDLGRKVLNEFRLPGESTAQDEADHDSSPASVDQDATTADPASPDELGQATLNLDDA